MYLIITFVNFKEDFMETEFQSLNFLALSEILVTARRAVTSVGNGSPVHTKQNGQILYEVQCLGLTLHRDN
jgi:hypothetical protein